MVDLPADITTTAVVTVGGSLSNTLETVGDRDWIRVTLTAGQTYTITLDATGADPLDDPYLYLYNSSGLLLRENDDGGAAGLNSAITYTVLTTGTYYIGAAGFDDLADGDYTVGVTAVPTPPPGDPLDSLDWGTTVADNNVTVYFATAGQTFDGYTSEGFNAYEKARFQAAFDLLESVSGLTFTIVTSAAAADFKLVLDTNEIVNEAEPFLGFFNPPGEANEGVGVFNGAAWDRTAGGSLETGGYDFVTITHEVLHGLGFAHPHDDGGTSAIMDGVDAPFDDYGDFNLNQGIFTTMSYNTGYLTGTPGSGGDVNEQWGYESGPMALDIALLQDKYGVNATTNTGSTLYVLDQVNADGANWQAIWDASGSSDEIRHDGSGSSRIDLRAATLLYAAGGGGYVTAVNGISGGFTIAHGVVIENATGGSGSDVLIGNSAANTLNGREGTDTLLGGAGNDLLFVDRQTDVIIENAGGGTADRVASSASYVLAADDNIERMQTTATGGTGAINLTGNALAQSIYGNAGANVLSDGGGAGVDTLIGSAGNDTYIVRNAGAQITEAAGGGTADRVAAGVSFALGSGDEIELFNTTSSGGTTAINLTGNSLIQSITGNAGANRINGAGGSDTLTGLGGADRFVFTTALGASNIDRITDYSTAADTIELQNSVFTGLLDGLLAATAFRLNSTGQAGDASDRVIYNSTNGYLYFDADGTGAGGRIAFAILDSGLAMTNADIFVV